MSVSSADILRRLSALEMPAEAMREVLSIIADIQSADEERKKKDRERKKTGKSNGKSEELPGKIHGNGQEIPQETPAPRAGAFSMGKVIDTLEAYASKGADAPSPEEIRAEPEAKPITPDAALYRRAREIAGPQAAALVTKLKIQNAGDIADTRRMVEQASAADDPLKYLAGMVARGQRKADFSGSPRPPPKEAPMSPRFRALGRIHNEPTFDTDDPSDKAAEPDASSSRGGAFLRACGA